VHIIKISKSIGSYSISIYTESLVSLDSDKFNDIQSANFYLQTLGKKYSMKNALIVIHDTKKNSVELQESSVPDSMFIEEN
jgi:hypothetical protein